MKILIFAVALAAVLTACASRGDDWGAISRGVGQTLGGR